jgi:hypothetical protein
VNLQDDVFATLRLLKMTMLQPVQQLLRQRDGFDQFMNTCRMSENVIIATVNQMTTRSIAKVKDGDRSSAAEARVWSLDMMNDLHGWAFRGMFRTWTVTCKWRDQLPVSRCVTVAMECQ